MLKHIETILDAALPREGTLAAAMRYGTMNGGKRLRGQLILATGADFSADVNLLNRAVCAMEALHAYSLIHDDLPAMDNDDWRRGQPSCHRQFDEATAILAGDGLQSWAFLQLAQNRHPRQGDALNIFAAAALAMVHGQMLDMEAQADPLAIHQLKTGALIAAALELGAIYGAEYGERRPTLRALGQSLGLAYQLLDDLLDCRGDSATLGKSAGKDLEQGKNSAVKVYGLAASEQLLEEQRRRSLELLDSLPQRGAQLRPVVEKMLWRDH